MTTSSDVADARRDRRAGAFDWIDALTILTRVLGASMILVLAVQQNGY